MESSEAEFSNKIVFNTTIESMGNDTVSNTSNTTTTDSFGELNLISYRYLMPAISAFGIIGNLIILLVLTSKELQMVSTNRQKVSQRSQSMFIYMKVLAVIDIFELIWTYQGAHFTLNGYWRVTAPAPIPTKAMANYVWNYMEPVWKTFMHSSDFVLVAMTVVRFQIVNTAHKFKRNESNGTLKSVCYCSIAVLLGLALNLPHFIHYDIVECDTIENCWTHKSSAISETVFWDVFGYLYVVLGKVLPFILIAVLDVIIFIKMKRIFKKRKRFRSTRRAALAMTTRTSITTDAEGTTPGIESSYEMQSFGDSNMTTTTKIIHKYELKYFFSEPDFKS